MSSKLLNFQFYIYYVFNRDTTTNIRIWVLILDKKNREETMFDKRNKEETIEYFFKNLLKINLLKELVDICIKKIDNFTRYNIEIL